jgi:hypothetical protein
MTQLQFYGLKAFALGCFLTWSYCKYMAIFRKPKVFEIKEI